jgi:ferrochelatase
LYPQYSLSATESSIDRVRSLVREGGYSAKLRFVPAFYGHPAFIRSFSTVAEKTLQEFPADHVLFSFHGLPERHVHKTDASGRHCLSSPDCCVSVGEANRNCYRAQSFATAHALARELGMSPADFGKRYSVAFQSRLGRSPWIRPYTDLVFSDLVKSGVKRLAVMCPSFVADCLETLEEIGIRGRESFIQLGGEDLRLIPSLNSTDDWARAVCEIAGGAY